MTLRVPPKKFLPPITFGQLAPTATLHRIHPTIISGVSNPATAFNPGRGKSSRFAPIWDEDFHPIPTMYLASTLEAAVFETIFHDVPLTSKALFRSVRQSEVVTRSHSLLSPPRPLKVATLHAPDLRRWRITRRDLIESNVSMYHLTARWAEAIYRSTPTIDGIQWTSKQCDPAQCYLLFGDRVGNMVASSTRDAVRSPDFVSEVRAFGQRAGITITV